MKNLKNELHNQHSDAAWKQIGWAGSRPVMIQVNAVFNVRHQVRFQVMEQLNEKS